MSEFVRICHIFTSNGCGLKTNWKESSLENILTWLHQLQTQIWGAPELAHLLLIVLYHSLPLPSLVMEMSSSSSLPTAVSFACTIEEIPDIEMYVNQEGGQEKNGTFIGL